MKHVFAYILILAMCTITGYSQDKLVTLEGESMYSKILKQEVKYSVCLPEDYFKSNASYPIVYMFHGLGDNVASWLEYGRIDVFSRERVNSGYIKPMIFIMPEGYTNYYVNDYYGKFLYQDMLIKELIPHVDKKYRTIADRNHRATIGYSMGGFGAFTVALSNQDVFGVTVPLSISIRTDEQYKTEEAPGWDEQWGRLFGGIEETGEKRLTDYYKKHNPFYQVKDRKVDLKIYISNGDDEGTLARSNEELHILMRDKNIPHEYRVRNGGHEFAYWYNALYDGLNFISDAFENKPYRGDEQLVLSKSDVVDLDTDGFKSTSFKVYKPQGYDQSNRLYPVIYVDARLTDAEKSEFAAIADKMISKMEIAPMILVFFDSSSLDGTTNDFISYCESKYRIREGRRFKAYLGYKDGGLSALRNAKTNEFTCVVAFDAPITDDCNLLNDIEKTEKKDFRNTYIFIDSSDKGAFYRGNGRLHLLLKDKDVYHEYRVRQSSEDNEYLFRGLNETLKFISNKVHK